MHGFSAAHEDLHIFSRLVSGRGLRLACFYKKTEAPVPDHVWATIIGRIVLGAARFIEDGATPDGDGEIFDVRREEVDYADTGPIADVLEWKVIAEIAWESIAVGFARQNVLQ